tara:strand:- start:2089 stop:2946 length:858 start_codon:yes stop_codon:yes gene_type:complete
MTQQITKSLNTSQIHQSLALIESSFQYKKPHHYKDDFYPLYNECFQPGRFALTDNDRVVAHLGYCLRELQINSHSFKVAFIGGIAVDQNERGKGYFKKIFEEALKQLTKQVDFLLLWSGDNALYEKFGFLQCGSIYQIGTKDNFSAPFKAKELCTRDLEQMRELYDSSWPNRVLRTPEQWQSLIHMPSVDLYIERENSIITSYAIKNKGFDLQGVVHEFAARDLEAFIKKFRDSVIWSPKKFEVPIQAKLWLAMAKAGDTWDESLGTLQSYLNSNEIMISGIDSV